MTELALLCVLIVVLAAFVARPLYGGRRTELTPGPAPGDPVVRTALEDLEIDRASGLVDDREYAAERATLEGPGTTND